MKRFLLLLAVISLITVLASSKSIPVSVEIHPSVINSINPLFFGHNYWLWPVVTWSCNIAGTETGISPLGVKFLRAGGQNNDGETPEKLSTKFMDDYAAYCSSVGATPLFQLPLVINTNVNINADDRVARAMELLHYYIDEKNYTLSWVSIGNEPDIYNWIFPDNNDMLDWDNYIDSFIKVAKAVREKYPDLQIVGPELSQSYWNPGNDKLTSFLKKCRSYIDAVSLHFYPFWPDTNATYDAAVKQFDIMKNMYSTVFSTLKTYGNDKPLIISECQISADVDPSHAVSEASLGTFEAGLWLADFLGISSAQPNLISVMPWSICESWPISFLDDKHTPRPVYYVYKLFSDHILSDMILCNKTAPDLRIYAYDDISGDVSLFCVNWDTNSYYSVRFKFTGGLLQNAVITYEFKPLSLTCLSILSGQTNGTAYIYNSYDADEGMGIETNDF